MTAKVSVRVGENLIESVITKQSVEEMGIKEGDTVTALIKLTEVMMMTDQIAANSAPATRKVVTT